MIEAVLDASALLAFLRNEPGADKVASVLTASCISTVNLSETLTKLVDRGKRLEEVAYQIGRLQVHVSPFDEELAQMAASLRPATREFGLSLGDRACLALALKRSLPALTTDKLWSKCDVGVKVVSIR